jgi:hypothetical protein
MAFLPRPLFGAAGGSMESLVDATTQKKNGGIFEIKINPANNFF